MIEVRLPDELLSHLLKAPSQDDVFDDAGELVFPRHVRSYLFAWVVIFDALRAASVRVRSMYADNLKESDSISPLLSLILHGLGVSEGKTPKIAAVGDGDGGGLQTTLYRASAADSLPDGEHLSWLLAYLFHQTLRLLPRLFRTWHMECRSKQLKAAAERWTTKEFSARLVAATLDDVQKWAGAQEAGPSSESVALEVTTLKRAGEVRATYEVDEQTGGIVVQLPENYPLGAIEVQTIKRVSVDEKKWQGWLRAVKGASTLGVSLPFLCPLSCCRKIGF